MIHQPDEIIRQYIGAYSICIRDGCLLLVRIAGSNPDAGRWGPPGGGVEPGEPPDDAVLRELREETGLDGMIIGLAGIYSHTYHRSVSRPRDPLQHIGIVYTVNPRSGDTRDEISGTTDTCDWVPLNDVPSLPLVPLGQFAFSLAQRHSGLPVTTTRDP